MIARATMIALLAAAPALAEETALTGAEIEALLPTIVAHGTEKETRQKFWPDGHTEYEERGQYSFGRWWVQADKYCSTWPPSEAVSCYTVLRDGERLIWVPRIGDPIVDRIVAR
ncbi:MAG: hypothetical protein AAGB15_09445 [Pseudomonadota bacterium]